MSDAWTRIIFWVVAFMVAAATVKAVADISSAHIYRQTRLPVPLQSAFPNLVEALEELMPLLCTLLVGFEGLVFVTVATLHDKLPAVVFEPLLGISPKSIIMIFDTNRLILILSGISSSLLYFCVINMVYSRMFRSSHLLGNDAVTVTPNDPKMTICITQKRHILEERRFTCSIVTLWLFNTAVLMIVVTGLCFAPSYIFSISVEGFTIIWLMNITFIYFTWRHHRVLKRQASASIGKAVPPAA